jgi:hypothetical protein
MIVGGGTIGGRKMRGYKWLVVVMVSFGVLVVLPPAASVAAAGEGCPNEGVRVELGESWLPDCRAYEMVTPPYKEGYPVLPESFASNGETVILSSLAGLAGTPGTTEDDEPESIYVDRRTADGWRLSSMMAPLSEFVGEQSFAGAFEADDGLSLWAQHTPRQSLKTSELYVRSEGGVYSRVGSLSPRVLSDEESDVFETGSELHDSPVAATSSFQHVVIEANFIPEESWPFDTTEGNTTSFYEYSGMNNERPVLVAVGGAEKGSENLIAVCGSELGSEPSLGSAYNALSSSGETIFFTVKPCSPAPETAEVYARLHGSMISPGPAETVDVSESECSTACGGQSGKNFEGASENGEKSFFTSTQKLTNDATDLTAGGSATEESGCAGTVSTSGCNLYEYDFTQQEHKRLTLIAGGAEDVRGVAGIAEDGSRVYFVAEGEVPGSGENEFQHKPTPGKPNLYVYDTGTGATAFIATLGSADGQDWRRWFNRPVEVTGEDGRFLLFASSAAGVTPDQTSGEGVVQLFEYDAVTGELVRVTQGEEGYDDNGNGATGIEPENISYFAKTLGSVNDFKSTTNRLNISEDGKTVVFATAGELSPRARSASSQGCYSVYEFRSEGPISTGKVRLLSDGHDVQPYKGESCGAKFVQMDGDGSNVLIRTSDPLLSSDADGGQSNIYDVRIDGGFPPASSSASCEGGGCEGAVSSPFSSPVFGVPASATVTGGGGNLSSPAAVVVPAPSVRKAVVRCTKDKKLSHGKCIRAKAKRRKRTRVGGAGDRQRARRRRG